MSDEKEVLDLVERALAVADNQRSEFLDSECGHRKKLREEVERLLKHSSSLETFLEPP